MTSLRQCINDKCRWCIYDKHAPGNWRQQITACTVVKCPLYPVRPLSRPQTRAEKGDKRVGAKSGPTLTENQGETA